MKDSHYRISLDIHSTQSQVSLPVKQGDTSRKVLISLCEGGKPYQIEEDCLAVFSAKKPDKNIIENNCIIADNVIEYTFTEQTTSVSGMLNCEIKLYGGDSGLITSPRFTVIVDSRAVSDEEVESYSEYLALTNLYTITNSAAANANGKAELANTAAENANTAADNADAKAALANTAASNANAVATEVETKLANGEFKGEKGDKGNPGKDADYNLVSNALKGYASGNSIRLDDVSPVEHTAKVKVHGKNLFNSDLFLEWFDKQDDGSYLANTEVPATRLPLDIPKGVYTLSIMLKSPENKNYRPIVVYADDTSEAFFKKSTGEYVLHTGVTNGKAIKSLFFDYSSPSNEVQFKNFQIELGTTATAYEPWLNPTTVTMTRYGASETDNLKTYTPNPDGTVEGVTSLYPTTTLITDTEGVLIDVEYNKDANKVIGELLGLVIGKTFVTDVKIYANKWVGTSSPYSQVVTVAGATPRSQVDLTPSAEQLAIFHSKDLAFVTENDGGVITVYAIGQKPANDYTIQATVTEVKV